jgi:hypothetical protein
VFATSGTVDTQDSTGAPIGHFGPGWLGHGSNKLNPYGPLSDSATANGLRVETSKQNVLAEATLVDSRGPEPAFPSRISHEST